MAALPVILLPGVVLPAEPAYCALRAALGPDVEALAKELEIYTTSEPSEDYSLEVEIAAVLDEADAHSWDRFHLVGYSAGGAAALAFAADHPERLASLGLLEPAWAGHWDLSPAEQSFWLEFDRIVDLQVEELMPAFMQLGIKQGVPLLAPPAGDPPPGWPNVPRASRRSTARSSREASTVRRCAVSIALSTSR